VLKVHKPIIVQRYISVLVQELYYSIVDSCELLLDHCQAENYMPNK